ncbi:MAG TPA: ribbon-helix-helix domain-containing protein [Bacillota bacterium]|nr:ribbon-helix-helix domain-containing protein [Bacillota bacterium]
MAATTRSLKNRVPISSSVDKEAWEGLQNLSKTTRINISKLLDEAIQDLLKKYQKSSD